MSNLPKNQPYFIDWENATDRLAEAFSNKYFGKNVEIDWVAQQIGGVLMIADYFFGVNDMADYLRYNYTRKDMFAHYDYALDCHGGGESPINIKTWRHLKRDEKPKNNRV